MTFRDLPLIIPILAVVYLLLVYGLLAIAGRSST